MNRREMLMSILSVGARRRPARARHVEVTIQAWDGPSVSRVFRTEIIPTMRQALALNCTRQT